MYDVRSDPAGSVFDGTRIERVNVRTKQIEVLYESKNGACVGVATVNPVDGRIVFIHGPEYPTPDWSYSACHREGVIVDPAKAGRGRAAGSAGYCSAVYTGSLTRRHACAYVESVTERLFRLPTKTMC